MNGYGDMELLGKQTFKVKAAIVSDHKTAHIHTKKDV